MSLPNKKGFKANKLALNSDKEKCIKCYAKNVRVDKLIEEEGSNEFLGQEIDNNMN
jgi:hypothetical protein